MSNAIEKALSSAKRTGGSNTLGTVNSARYAAMQRQFIRDLCRHKNPSIRIAALTNPNVPSKLIVAALENEKDRDVLRALLTDTKAPKKALVAFADSPQSSLFDSDPKVIEAVVDRLGTESHV